MIYDDLDEALRARSKLWDGKRRLSLLYRATEMAGECGEACNIVKKIERARMGMQGSRSNYVALADELADVVITAYNAARAAGINLTVAIPMKFNKTSRKQGFPVLMEVPEQ